MSAVSAVEDASRQVLVNLGNRYVVFAPSPGLPQPSRFNPETDSVVLPRVADESEVAEARIAETLRVSGMRTSTTADTSNADIELIDDTGNHILIDIKVRERDPTKRDFDQGQALLKAAADVGQTLEIWYFNIERLKLTVMRGLGRSLQFEELTPINVWEKTDTGIFDRFCVVEEVDDWINRVNTLYADIQTWLADNPNLRFDRSRTVIMSEEIMQKFAVPDREISVLDVFGGDQVIASFVPRGLWLIGAWGRVDIITRDRTRMLFALRREGKLEWRLVAPDNRLQTELFDKNTLLATIMA